MNKALFLALIAGAFVATPALAQKVDIDKNSMPKGWHIKNVTETDRKAAEQCEPPNKIVVTNQYKTLPNGNRFYLFDCVNGSDPRPAAKR